MRKFILASMTVLALTACGSNSTATPADPVTKTVTVTETPDPVTQTVTKTPKSCQVALAAAERVFGHASEFATTASKFPPLIVKAYHSGMVMDNAEAQFVIDRMKTLTGEVKVETSNVTQDRETFDRNAALCREGQ